jgi:DNA-binding MarR family transcriptional regulator
MSATLTVDRSFLPLIRELVRTYQAFERYSAAHVEQLGLTPAQFDVVATLGNTEGMNAKQLGERTLITKGTLTGVVDRLLLKGLVMRLPDPRDGRAQIVRLTQLGQETFERVFPAHGAHLARVFASVPQTQRDALEQQLRALRAAFDKETT